MLLAAPLGAAGVVLMAAVLFGTSARRRRSGRTVCHRWVWGPGGSSGMAFGVGGLLLLALLPLLAPAVDRDPAPVLLLVLYLAVVPTAVASLLFAWGLQRLPAPTVATLTLAGLSVLAVSTGRGRTSPARSADSLPR